MKTPATTSVATVVSQRATGELAGLLCERPGVERRGERHVGSGGRAVEEVEGVEPHPDETARVEAHRLAAQQHRAGDQGRSRDERHVQCPRRQARCEAQQEDPSQWPGSGSVRQPAPVLGDRPALLAAVGLHADDLSPSPALAERHRVGPVRRQAAVADRPAVVTDELCDVHEPGWSMRRSALSAARGSSYPSVAGSSCACGSRAPQPCRA